jgi:iron complex transport system ATP-binding protein
VSTLLACKEVESGYAGRTVLHKVSFTVDRGECVALLGPNGSGKSTLLRACTKTNPYTGSITLESSEVADLSHAEVARRVSFVPQEELFLFPFLVREVVVMGRISRASSLLDSREDIEQAVSAMDFAGCTPLAERPITELSGGERQRVLIARAMAQGSPLMLLDEPSSHLDIAHQTSLAQLIGKLKSDGIGLLIAIHDLNLAARLADRALLLREGHIVEDGPIRSVLESSLLDEVYAVEFERIETSDGSLAILSRLPT